MRKARAISKMLTLVKGVDMVPNGHHMEASSKGSMALLEPSIHMNSVVLHRLMGAMLIVADTWRAPTGIPNTGARLQENSCS